MFSNQGSTNSISDLLRNIPGIGGLMAAVFNSGADVGDKVGKSLIRGLLSEVGGGRFRSLLSVGLAGALTALVSGSVALAVAQARSRLDLSQASGMSLSQASGAVTNLKAFGIDTDSVPGVSQNSFFQQMRSGVYGVRGTPGSAEYLRSYRDRYQGMSSQGPMGLMQAQNMEGSLGMGGARFMANLSQPDYDRQMKRSDAIQGAFGMKPEDIKRAAVDFSLFNASLSQFIELGLAKVGTTILPYLTGMLNHAIDWVSANGEKFSEGLVSAVQTGMNALMSFGKWLYASFPVIVVDVLRFLNGVVGSFAKSVTSGVDFVRGPITSLFNGIGRMAVGIGNTVKGILDTVSQNPLAKLVMSSLGGAGTSKGAQQNATVGGALPAVGLVGSLGLAAAYGRGLSSAGGAAAGASSGGGVPILNTLWGAYQKAMGIGKNFFLSSPGNYFPGAGNPVVQASPSAASALGSRLAALAANPAFAIPALGVAFGVGGYEWARKLNPAFGKSHASAQDITSYLYQRALGNSDDDIHAHAVRNARGDGAANAEGKKTASGVSRGNDGSFKWNDYNPSDLLGGLRNGAQGVSAWSDKTDAMLAGWQKSMGTQEERGKGFDAFTKLDEIAKNTKRSADATEKMPSILNQFGQQIVSRAVAYEKQDTTRNMMRGFSNI